MIPSRESSELDRRTMMKAGCAAALGASLGAYPASAAATGHQVLTYDEYAKHDAVGLAELVSNGDVTPRELLDMAIARAEAVNPKINAIVINCYEQARKAIKHGLPKGAFTGVPFLVKDLGFAMKGVKATAGSRLFETAVPDQDDTVVKRYRKAGLVIFGRTHSPEFGLIPVSESALHGTTCNPWDLDRTAGGSSGGSAAAVTSGIVPLASGSDGGGSIRIPASCCGLFGLKPTRARVPLGPEVFEIADGVVVVHAITRSVRDSAALLDATMGPELGDAYWAPPPVRPFLEEVGRPPGKLRIGLTFTCLPDVPLHDDCRKATEDAAGLCETLGHHVEDVTDRFAKLFPFEDLIDGVLATFSVGTAQTVQSRLATLGRDLQERDVETYTRQAVEQAGHYTAFDMAKGRETIHRASRLMAQFQQEYDVILSPTLAKPPVPHGSFPPSPDLLSHVAKILSFFPYTPLANWTGQPAMSVPLYWTSAGLPIGVHFFGRFGDEATLFRLAAQLEEARPWNTRRPKI